jgi:2-polyprenyl-3-methyl-5-hydroxy-6-metoxy-1,4-benzoquinol methylase
LNGWLKSWAQQKAQQLSLAFGVEILATLPPGRFMDVGCGSGNIVSLANQLGWESEGIEIDPVAVKSARHAELNVNEGSYELLNSYSQIFDVVLCSHVIEHVYDPFDLLLAIHSSLRPGGLLLLSTPNAQSDVHQFFGPYWRGLEAPRHLTILNESILVKLLEKVGFEVVSHADSRLETFKQSRRIEKLAAKNTSNDLKINKRNKNELQRSEGGHDFIKLCARKL